MSNQLANGRPAEILLAEDNDDDVELTRQGFRRALRQTDQQTRAEMF